jgi:hypothetical protein
VLAYLGENQGFANDHSASTLARVGLPAPEVESYLDVVLRYYLGKSARQR